MLNQARTPFTAARQFHPVMDFHHLRIAEPLDLVGARRPGTLIQACEPLLAMTRAATAAKSGKRTGAPAIAIRQANGEF
jgi:hypothetical protein